MNQAFGGRPSPFVAVPVLPADLDPGICAGGPVPLVHDGDHHLGERRGGLGGDRAGRTRSGRTAAPPRPCASRTSVTSRGVVHRAAVGDRGRDQRHLQRVHEVVVQPDRGEARAAARSVRSTRVRGTGRSANGSSNGIVGSSHVVRSGGSRSAQAVRLACAAIRVGTELEADLGERHVARLLERLGHRDGRCAAVAVLVAEVLELLVRERAGRAGAGSARRCPGRSRSRARPTPSRS